MMQNRVYPANSYIDITHIKEEKSTALMCVTAKRPCCTSVRSDLGWYYPESGPGRVPSENVGQNFYVTKRNDGTISLHRRNDALAPNGRFCCILYDEDDNVVSVCAHLSKFTTKPILKYVIV